ncbi:MAG: tRNA 2-thiouridine(34) synthase MnmA [Patescibacteria group bacterium]
MSKTVVVGLSGGVDSSVTALLLKEQGFNVLGVFMKNWSDSFALKNGECPWEQDQEDARQIAGQLGIDFQTMNFEKEYKEHVIDYFFKEYKSGRTPNPDIMCNSEIKFKVFFEKALDLGADYIATGHYARVEHTEGQSRLLKGVDNTKDQSYFLYAIDQAALQKTLFPVGEYKKSHIRDLAKKNGLMTHDKKDSQGICFVGEVDMREFLGQYIDDAPGNIVDLDTKEILGTHHGLAWYTIGQRKGMAVGGTGLPLYVAGKDMNKNELYVVKGNYNPHLFKQSLEAHDLHWISDTPEAPGTYTAKIRYRQADQACVITKKNADTMQINFEEKQRAVTPGQSVVVYDGDYCLGGGVIS